MAQKNYPDIQVKEGDQTVTNDERGFKCIRRFVVSSADQTTPTSTLYNVITAGAWIPSDPLVDIPERMTPHPTIVIPSAWGAYMASGPVGLFSVNNCFCADVITCRGLTGGQMMVEVEYSVFNARTQEPTDLGDVAPGLLEIGSSVQSTTTAYDSDGNPISIMYLTSAGIPSTANDVYLSGDASVGDPWTAPTNLVLADYQAPAALIRFWRRERQPQDAFKYTSTVNQVAWTIAGVEYPEQSMLCTRVENSTHDEGLSYVVLYEFIARPLQKTVANSQFQSPATPITISMVQYQSPWQFGQTYILQQGIGVDHTTKATTFGVNTIPPDAVPIIYQIYGTTDFKTDLALN